MKTWQIACIVGGYAVTAAVALTAISQVAGGRPSISASVALAAQDITGSLPNSLASTPSLFSEPDAAAAPLLNDTTVVLKDQPADAPQQPKPVQQAKLETDESASDVSPSDVSTSEDAAPDASAPPDLSYLVYYVYSEVPPEQKPAEIALDALKNLAEGTPKQEVKRAANIFGLDVSFMETVAKIESDFDPKERTGSYIGLFQLSHYEFNKYGSGEITDARDNAIAAGYKFITEAIQFEWATHKKPSFSDLYLIHQQGWQGAAEHVAHPERIAWQSMCATDEGQEKGEKWCKRAVWGNTLPDIKHIWKSVDKLTSGAFVTMWRERVDTLYARYAAATITDVKQ